MSRLLAVFGATGQQGSSVVDYVLNDTELSERYTIRAITRDVNSKKAKQLSERVEIAQGDLNSRASLETALTGAHTVFAMTPPSFGPDALDDEYNSAKTIADVAVEKGAEYIIFSTLPSVKEISGGKYTKVSNFEAKAKAEKYMRGLPIKSAFYAAGGFMENFQTHMAPRQAPDGTWVIASHCSPKTKTPLVDATGDTGKFVGAILAEPDKYESKTFCAATALYSSEEVAAAVSKATGKTVISKQIPVQDFRESLASLPPALADILIEAYSYQEEFGYFGPDTENLVAWATKNARGRLCTLEEYLEAHPLHLA